VAVLAMDRPSERSAVALSPGCNLTSEKIAPLQHRPHARQMLSEERTAGDFKFYHSERTRLRMRTQLLSSLIRPAGSETK
jgi:hypothetical protein